MFAARHPAHSRCLKPVFLIAAMAIVSGPTSLRLSADIYRWDTGEVIPGTEGIELVDGVNLDHMDLEYANFTEIVEVDAASFDGANLTMARFESVGLSQPNFERARLGDVRLIYTSIRGGSFAHADLTGADIDVFYFTDVDFREANLTRAWFSLGGCLNCDFRGANLSDARGAAEPVTFENSNFEKADLTGARFSSVRFSNSSFRQANLTNFWTDEISPARFDADVDFTDATITAASLPPITFDQLRSTANYKNQDLRGVHFVQGDYSGADFRQQDLSDAFFNGVDLREADLTGANLTNSRFSEEPPALATGAEFTGAIMTGAYLPLDFSKNQLQSTASYQNGNLRGVHFPWGADLSAVDFRNHDLTGVSFNGANLTDSDLRFANLTDAFMSQSTLTAANLTGANLTNALVTSRLTNSNLSAANLINANFDRATEIETATFNSASVYNQWTVFPEGFDPVAERLSFVESPVGDLDGNNRLGQDDINRLVDRIVQEGGYGYLPDPAYDVNEDSRVDHGDLDYWIRELKGTWYGDANLDGEFNSSDLLQVFKAGEYDDDILRNSDWSTGDWNADGEFESGDLIVAFQDGGYEQGPRVDANAVPEPASLLLLIVGLVGIAIRCRYVADSKLKAWGHRNEYLAIRKSKS